MESKPKHYPPPSMIVMYAVVYANVFVTIKYRRDAVLNCLYMLSLVSCPNRWSPSNQILVISMFIILRHKHKKLFHAYSNQNYNRYLVMHQQSA